jgi:hypothetical protein
MLCTLYQFDIIIIIELFCMYLFYFESPTIRKTTNEMVMEESRLPMMKHRKSLQGPHLGALSLASSSQFEGFVLVTADQVLFLVGPAVSSSVIRRKHYLFQY